ncbi:MAG: AAA family ATPase [Myxococcota bacterium]
MPMLRSLSIKNYRLFKSLTLPRLGQLNLIVGKNNSGKSCLLEAVRIYEEDGDPNLLRRLIHQRHEDIEVLTRLSNETLPHPSLSDPLRNLFPEHKFPNDFITSIRIGEASKGSRLVEIHLGANRPTQDENGNLLGHRLSMHEALDLIDEARFFIEVRVISDDEVVQRRTVRLKLPGKAADMFSRTSRARLLSTRYVPASGWNQNQIIQLWSTVLIRPSRKRQVIDALRLIDSDIQDIALLPEAVPVAIYSDDFQQPLRGMGDGMGRLFQLALAVASTDSGVVLLDEFENGLHWSVQSDAWRFVFSLAKATNTQVFATTHSWDCVQAFQRIDAEHPDTDGMLFHLGRSVRTSNRGQIVANAYDSEALKSMVQADIEVR